MTTFKWLGRTAVLLALAGGVFFVASWAYVSVREVSLKKLDQTSSQLRDKKAEFKLLEQDLADWRHIQPSYQEFKKEYLHPFSEFPTCRERLKSVILNPGLELIKFTHQYRNLTDEIVKIELRLEISGTYPGLKECIGEIELLPGIIYIKNCHFAKNSSGQISGILLLEAYFEK